MRREDEELLRWEEEELMRWEEEGGAAPRNEDSAKEEMADAMADEIVRLLKRPDPLPAPPEVLDPQAGVGRAYSAV